MEDIQTENYNMKINRKNMKALVCSKRERKNRTRINKGEEN